MGKLYQYIYILVAISLLMTACNGQPAQAHESAPNPINYFDLLGKPLSDESVTSLLAVNHCTKAIQVQLCKDAGIAFWLDTEQIVKKLYLYLNNKEGFAPFKGELPLGLKFYDTMGAVEYKLKKLEAGDSLQATESAGLPDEGDSPDHMHYWAVYRRYDMTIIYNSPFADEDATIYAIVIGS